jgi:hypothetical protein
MFIFEKYLKFHSSIEIEKIYLVLPFVFDNNVMKKFSRIEKIPNLIDFVINETRLFSQQKKLYYEYLILTTNTLQLCIENDLIQLDKNIIKLKEENCLFNMYDCEENKKLKKIVENLEKFSKILKNEESYELYHSLRIEV